ncbi:LON peptidase substrate-binding domain-containing protein [Thiohalorhabdus methylotrophus]|uniref:LON peptidase substrate-binding domain-containing protein n=1 Tax=Thiohalorhabdus methylotrophus TaxID=3242694 RepID=A0ABV4TU14_9GAMM
MGTRGRYPDIDALPSSAPVFPLTGAVLLPRVRLPLNIFEPRYLAMVDAALAGDRVIGMIQPATAGAEGESMSPDLARVGCLGRLSAFSETEDGRYLITLTGLCRFSVGAELEVDTPFRQVRMEYGHYSGDLKPAPEPDLDRRRLLGALEAYLQNRELEVDWDSLEGAGSEGLVNTLAMMLPLGAREKQGLLLAETLNQRAQLLVTLLEMDRSRGSEDDSDTPLQ